ncbi:S-adenosyl-L-methionine-dependent methyltransferase, partial [Mycena filopes]
MSPSTDNAIAMAEHLLALVKQRSGSHPSSTEFYNKSIEVQATCESLLRVVMGPLQYTALVAESCQESQALNFVTQFGIADIIGDGPALSLVEISQKTGVDTQFLGVVMNCMSGLGYFDETAGRYRNNALSAVLREDHPNSMKSAIGFVCDEGYNAASRLVDVAKRRGLDATADNDNSRKRITGTNLAFNFDCSVFDWMAQPEQTWRGKRLGLAMKQLHGVVNGNVPLDYEWSALQSPIIDCGGGIGALEMAILKEESNRGLAFTLFDIPETIENAKKAWSTHPAHARVSFAPGNFLAPTLAETGLPLGAPTYLIRHVLHDWTDAEVLQILRAVRLLALNNGVTRTLGAMRALIEEAGFTVSKVHSMRAVDSIVEAVVRE